MITDMVLLFVGSIFPRLSMRGRENERFFILSDLSHHCIYDIFAFKKLLHLKKLSFKYFD